MILFSRTLCVFACTASLSALATPSFDSLTIRSTEISAPNEHEFRTVSIDPVTGVRTDRQFQQSDINGWELKFSEQISENSYWTAGYRNDRSSSSENTQIYQPSPITISTLSQHTRFSTRQYSLGAGYIFDLSKNTTLDFSGNIGRLKLKTKDVTRYGTEQSSQTYWQDDHNYTTIAGYQARVRHEFGDDIEFYATIGGERWYADTEDTVRVQTVGLNYFIFGDTAISFEYGKYDDEARTAIGAHFRF
jgi:hypothetical protein